MDLKKKLKVFSFFVLGVLLFGYVALFVTAKIFFPSHRLKETIAQRLSNSLNRQVEIGEVGVSVFPRLRFQAQRVKIANPENFSDTAFVQISKLLLDVKLLPLLNRQIEVASIVIDRPEVFIEKNQNGDFNFASKEARDKPPPPPGESMASSPVSLLVNSAKIVDGRVSYVDRQKHKSAEIRGIDEDLALSFDRERSALDVDGRTEVAGAQLPSNSGKPDKLNLPAVTVKHHLRIDTRTKNVTIETLQLLLSSARLTFAGALDRYDTLPRIDLKLQTNEIELGDLLEMGGSALTPRIKALKGKGKVHLNLSLKGEISEKSTPAVQGEMSFADLELSHPELPHRITGLTGALHFSNDKLSIRTLTARVGNAPIELSGAIGNLQHPTFDLKMKTELQLDEIRKYTSLPEGTQIAGRMRAALRVRGQANDPDHASFQGKVKLAEGSLTSPDLSVPVTDISADLKLTGQDVQISTLAFKAGKSSATITGKIVDPVNRPRGHLTLVSPLLDLDELLPSAHPETPAAQAPSSSRPVKLPFEALEGEVRVKKLVTNEMALNDVRAKVHIRDNVLRIENLTSRLYSGRLTGEATGDFNDPSGLAYEIQVKCNNVDVNNFASSVIPMKDTFFGNMDLEMRARGKGLSAAAIKGSLVGEGSTVISKGRLARLQLLKSLATFLKLPSFENLHFNTVKTRFELKDQKVAFDRLKLSAFGNDIAVEGFMGLDGALNFSVSILLSEQLTQRFRQKAVNVPTFLLVDSRRLPIDLLVTGSTERPAIAWNTEKALRRSAETRVQRGLRTLLSGLQKKTAESTVAEKDTSSARQDTLQVRKAEKTEEPVKDILRGLRGLFGKKKKKKKP